MNTELKAEQLRKEIMDVAVANSKGHIAPSLSCLDILTVLYYDVIGKKDVVILSKGHGCYGLYAIQADFGLIAMQDWKEFKLSGCLKGYGSLGHGLPVAVGHAYGLMKQKKKGHVYCIVGDGEMQEGSFWEALTFMFHHELKNITVIIDNNELQAMDYTDSINSTVLNIITNTFCPSDIDGHDHEYIKWALNKGQPIILAETIKGNGYPFMEGKAEWHFKIPSQEDLDGCE